MGDEVIGVGLDGVRGDARPLAHLQCAGLAGEADGQVVRRADVLRAGSSHGPTLAHQLGPGTRPVTTAGPGSRPNAQG